MSKNRIEHLTDHLFSALECLNNEELEGEDLQQEVQRCKAISDVADKVIDVAKVSLEAEKLKADYLSANQALPQFFLPHP